MNDEFGSLLRRLGVTKGARNLKSPSPSSREEILRGHQDNSPLPLETLLPGGRLLETVDGGCFIVERVYPAHYRHGLDTLGDLLMEDPGVGARYALENRLDNKNFRDFVFLDTETTGLAGAGALAFMIGVAYFEPHPTLIDGKTAAGDAFVVRQYFLRDHDDEPVVLQHLDELVTGKQGLITFNGRSFDVPLLANRYLMNRRRGRLVDMPHIDLLPPARRLYRTRLGSCALGALEQNLLGLHRTHDDVPGWLIPSLYHNYLRTGDASELTRVFYHNEMDMLSMVTLAGRIFRLLSTSMGDHVMDRVSLGRWQADLGMHAEAEMTLRGAMDDDSSLEAYEIALQRLSHLYKQTERRAEAVVAWQQLAAVTTADLTPFVELAKHFEWHEVNIPAAQLWTNRALSLLDRLPLTPNSRLARAELAHRLQRLEKKLS